MIPKQLYKQKFNATYKNKIFIVSELKLVKKNIQNKEKTC